MLLYDTVHYLVRINIGITVEKSYGSLTNSNISIYVFIHMKVRRRFDVRQMLAGIAFPTRTCLRNDVLSLNLFASSPG